MLNVNKMIRLGQTGMTTTDDDETIQKIDQRIYLVAIKGHF